MEKKFDRNGVPEQPALPSEKYVQDLSSLLGVTLMPLAEEEKPEHFKMDDVYKVSGVPNTLIALYPRRVSSDNTSYLCFAVQKPDNVSSALNDIVAVNNLSNYPFFVEGVLGSIDADITSIQTRPLVEILDSLTNPNLYQ